MNLNNRRFLLPIILFLSTLGIHYAFGKFPHFYEQVYLRGIFAFIRGVYDTIIGSWLPFPFLLVIVVFLLVYLFFVKKPKSFFVRFIYSFIAIVVAFYWLWGFNYQQKSIAARVNMQFTTPDIEKLQEEIAWTIEKINSIRDELQDDSLALQLDDISQNQLKEDFNILVPEVLREHQFTSNGNPTIRILQPKGILMRFKTAGIYIPHAFEGHVDGGLLPLEIPFTYAHELSHAYGLTDEGECNYIAFLVCLKSANKVYQYSALIDYSLYLLRDLRKLDKELYLKAKASFHAGYHADVEAMHENGKKYPDILPGLRDIFYDRYLKSLGVKEGLKSYSKLVAYVIAARSQQRL